MTTEQAEVIAKRVADESWKLVAALREQGHTRSIIEMAALVAQNNDAVWKSLRTELTDPARKR
jgi:predicted transcriptional regulator